jgi:hypothetical protein
MGGVRCDLLLLLHASRLGPGQGRQGGRQGESRALLGGQRIGLGLPTTVANSCFDFVRFLPTKCLLKCPQEIKIRIFEIFKLG